MDCDIEVGDVCVSLSVEQDVVGLEITVDDALLVQVGEATGELGYPKANDMLGEASSDVEMDCGRYENKGRGQLHVYVHRKSPPIIRSST